MSFKAMGSFPKEDSGLPQSSANISTADEHQINTSISSTVLTIPDARKGNWHRRRHQLHLWISEKEYTMLKELAELHEEPMSRIIRRLFTQLKHLQERKAG